jgi:PPK2 family polyphosphate:nucleotide phosphotransferase
VAACCPDRQDGAMAKKSKDTKKLEKKAAKKDKADAAVVEDARSLADLLRVDKGFVLADVDCESTPGFTKGKVAGREALADHASELGDWQEKLYAESKAGRNRSLLLVVQGMDTSGKGGLMRHVVNQVDPEGIKATAFKAPTPEERKHDFLWRIRNALPAPGKIGIFDRSQYEDVLVVRVHDLVPRSEWMKRYALINAFEREVAASGTKVVKIMTHISKDEQKERLRERLARPDKHYKYNPGDIDEREQWDAYMEAYQAVLDKTSTKGAPWYVVPANKKWYARYAVQQLLLDALVEMDPTWPEMGIDVPHELERLDAS